MRPVTNVVAINTIRQPVVSTWHDINQAASHNTVNIKRVIRSKIKHAIKLKTSPARLA